MNTVIPAKIPSTPVSPIVNLSNFAIDENKQDDNVFPLTVDEKMQMLNTPHPSSSGSISNDFKANSETTILWKGEIFETVQSLRHFKDSKSFVDHVLKISNKNIVCDYFTKHVLNYNTADTTTSSMSKSKSFGNTQQRNNLAKLKLVHSDHTDDNNNDNDDNNDNDNDNNDNNATHLPRRGSFPRYLHNKYFDTVMSKFIETYFFTPGFELYPNLNPTPIDHTNNPNTDLFKKILVVKDDKDINTKQLLYFATELNKLWKLLYRVVNPNVAKEPYRYSFIPLKHPQIFVPGGRFREIYYWDSFWIIQGLLCCGMITSAIRIVENMIDLVERIGFVPNGTRNYYRTRSQPPLLTLMAQEIYATTKDKNWLQSHIGSLVKEYEYWNRPPIQITITTNDNKCYTFARYYSSITEPRPESYYEDRMCTLPVDNIDKKKEIYRNIRAAAASGWDFSSRWYYDDKGAYGSDQIIRSNSDFNLLDDNANDVTTLMNLMKTKSISDMHDNTTITDAALSVNGDVFDEFAQQRMQFTDFSLIKLDTCNVVPVDLNVFLCKVEGALSKFYDILGNKIESEKYKKYQINRINGMLELLWDETNKQFRDWNFRYKCFGNLHMASNFSPLWLQCDDHLIFTEKRNLLIESLNNSKLICSGGIVTTLFETGEQWDYPNCWPPLNAIIIEGLYNMGQNDYALKLANIWVNNNYHTFINTKNMHEKYHCEQYRCGGGGEYKPQVGFGWTNGVVLKFLEMFGPQIQLQLDNLQ